MPPLRRRPAATRQDANSNSADLDSGPNSPARPDESSVDGSVHTPNTRAMPRGLADDLARAVGRGERLRRTQRKAAPAAAPMSGGADSSDDDEATGNRILGTTIWEAREAERRAFVRGIEAIHEDGDDEDEEDPERVREREAVRSSRRIGRWTKVKCFMCSYGNHEHDGTADKGSQAFTQLRNMMRQRYAYSELLTLSIDLAEFYRVALREPSRQADGTYALPEMLPSDFMVHIKYHNLNPQIMIGEDMRMIRDMLEVLRMQLEHATGKMGLRIIDTIIKLMKQKSVYMSQGARPMLFEGRNGNDPIGLDPQTMGDVANMTRIRPYIMSTRTNVIGGATATNTSQPRQGLPRFDLMRAAVAENDVEEEEEEGGADDASVQTSPSEEPQRRRGVL